MDLESLIQDALHPDKCRLRHFIKDAFLFLIENDPTVDEESRNRVSSLNIKESGNFDFKPGFGIFLVQLLNETRQYCPEYDDYVRLSIQSIIITNDSGEEFAKALEEIENFVVGWCRLFLNRKCPCLYVSFLITVCQFCSKIAELDEHEGFVRYLLQRAGFYMTLYQGAFPGYEVLDKYADERLR